MASFTSSSGRVSVTTRVRPRGVQAEHGGQVGAGPHDRPDHRGAVQHRVEDRDLQCAARREGHQHQPATAPQARIGGSERLVVHGQPDATLAPPWACRTFAGSWRGRR